MVQLQLTASSDGFCRAHLNEERASHTLLLPIWLFKSQLALLCVQPVMNYKQASIIFEVESIGILEKPEMDKYYLNSLSIYHSRSMYHG